MENNILTSGNMFADKHLSKEQSNKAVAVTFIRESTVMQLQNGVSIQSQVDHAKKKAAKLEVDLPEQNIFIEISSASKKRLSERPQLAAVLEYIEKLKPKYLIVWKRDRLARNVSEYKKIWNICRKSNTTIVFTSPEEPPIGEGVFAGFQETMFAAVNELESEIIGQRVRDTRRSLVQSGEVMIGTPAYGYGYDPDKKSYFQIPEQIEIYTMIKNWYLLDNLGYSKIAIKLNEELKISSPKGGSWAASTIARILKNPFYCGHQRASYQDEEGGKLVRKTVTVKCDKIEPCIDPKDYDAILQKIETKKTHQIPPREFTTSFLFSGLLICSKCGSKFVCRQSSEYNAKNERVIYYNYRCSGYTLGRSCACSIAKYKLESSVTGEIFRYLKDLDIKFIIEEAERQIDEQFVDLHNVTSSLTQELNKIKNNISLNQNKLESTSSVKMQNHWASRIEELLEKRQILTEKLVEVETQTDFLKKVSIEKIVQLNALCNYETIFEQSTPEARRSIILNLVERLEYDPRNRIATVVLKLNEALFNSRGLSIVSDDSVYKDHSFGRLHFEVKIA
jgi:site-specific DNA recombinase